MKKFDRYMLSQFVVMFGFFALVLVAIFWTNEAKHMFDRLINDGQSAWIFMEFTALTLPGVIGVVLPIASFAGAVYVINRLSNESELTVVQATGYSPYRLLRPVLIYGLIVAAMMSLLVHVLIPTSLSHLSRRMAEMSQNVSAKLLTEGEFLHPSPGVTFYIGDITPRGELDNVFLSDRRDPKSIVTYSSKRAYLVQGEDGTRLVMVSGLAQTLKQDGQRLFVTRFDDFSYDISALVHGRSFAEDKVKFFPTLQLIRDPAKVAEKTGASMGMVTIELHDRFNQALMCIVAAVVGFSTLMLGAYSRFEIWRQIVGAFSILIVLKALESVVLSPVKADPAMWPLLYSPTALGALLSWGMLHLSVRPALWRRLTGPFTRLAGLLTRAWRPREVSA